MITLFFKRVWHFPSMWYYWLYDHLCYWYFREYKLFYGWGIHLFTGKFGKGKTSIMTMKAYELACKYPQLTILTNIKLKNFPEHTNILELKHADDILNAPNDTLVLIDEIGTLFNSRDFTSGQNSVPKPMFQHLCQCRKRKMMIYATVQRFNLLDKQIRDITADVTECHSSPQHPFTRILSGINYDIDEYEAYCLNRLYNPRIQHTDVYVQTNQSRQLYDTSELVQGLLQMKYLSDEEILRNQGGDLWSGFGDGSKEGQKNFKKAMKRHR